MTRIEESQAKCRAAGYSVVEISFVEWARMTPTIEDRRDAERAAIEIAATLGGGIGPWVFGAIGRNVYYSAERRA